MNTAGLAGVAIRISKRQLRIELDFPQHDACAHLRDGRNLEDAFVQKRVICLDVRCDDLEDVVGFAGGAVALGHFRTGGDLAFELFDPAFRVPRQMDVSERAYMQPQLFAIQQCRVALDHPRLLHVLDPPPAWGAGEADLVGDLLHRTASVKLQQAQDLLRERIECQLRLRWRAVALIVEATKTKRNVKRL